MLAGLMSRLESLGNEKIRERNARSGPIQTQFGVAMGDIRTLAKEIKLNPELAAELWATGNFDARMLSLLLMKPKALSAETLEAMVQSERHPHAADWLNSYVVKAHPQKEKLRQKWMQASDPMLLRSAWSLTTERVIKSPDGLDMDALLDRIESEMATAAPEAQWTMNFALGEIGIQFPAVRERAIAIGEKLGLYRDYPTSKGCTSPFVPIWVREMVSRKG